MPGFADSFWSGDYAGGLGVLFGKLQQGVIENDQILMICRMRAEAEEQYGRKLAAINPATERLSGGFQRDDGASLKKAYEGVRTEMNEAARNHEKISSNISELVVIPFGRWCESHEGRVMSSHDDLQARIKAHDKQAELVRKIRSTYFNKCRQVEDLEEENKLAFQEPEKEASPKGKTPTIKLPEPEQPEEEPVEIGDETYNPEQVKLVLTAMLNSIKVGDAKVPILGTYQNVSTGADIVDFVQKGMGASSVSYAERIGQDLVDLGFLRLVGNVGSTFANSSKMNYQWRPKVFQITGIPEKKSVSRVSSIGSVGSDVADSPIMGSMGEMLSTWNPLNNPYPNETPLEKMKRESKESDEKYKAAVKKLDLLRCNLEEAIVDHLKFMERCEMDRLKAIKAVMLDFSGAMSNVIPSLQSTVDNMMLYQEAVQPLADVRYLIDNYRTGSFVPKVQIYDNYYHHVDEQTYGVDLEARARHDRKRVPIVITTILTFLDNHYPDLEGDEARRSIWTVDVPLAATHHLRNSINTGKAPPRELLERYEVPIVASALKLYLLELPDSLVSAQVYDVMKTIYASPDSSTNDETRIAVLQNTLGQLRLANIATLDALMTHFTRLIELTSAEETFVASLAQTLAPCVLRPRTESSLTISERHPYRLVRDLFAHKEAIFGELKRASSQSQSLGAVKDNRARAPSSTDESNRRANMEARTRAIMSKTHRGVSPGPAALQSRHRRDRSVGGGERFPVVSSPTVAQDPKRRVRESLEVPDGAPETPHGESPLAKEPLTGSSALPDLPTQNGTSEHAVPAQAPTSAQEEVNPTDAPGVAKKDSITRSSAGARLNRKAPGSGSGNGLGMLSRAAVHRDSVGSNRDSVGSVPEHPRTSLDKDGVTLTDRPMDD